MLAERPVLAFFGFVFVNGSKLVSFPSVCLQLHVFLSSGLVALVFCICPRLPLSLLAVHYVRLGLWFVCDQPSYAHTGSGLCYEGQAVPVLNSDYTQKSLVFLCLDQVMLYGL